MQIFFLVVLFDQLTHSSIARSCHAVSICLDFPIFPMTRCGSPSIKLCGVVVQGHAGEFQGAFAGNLAILHHSGEGDGQGFTA